MKFILKAGRAYALSALLLAGVSSAQASSPSPGKILSFSLKESHTESVVKFTEEGDSYYDIGYKNSSSISLSMELAQYDDETGEYGPLDLDLIDESTEFTIDLGNLSLVYTLADDPKYTQGKRSAFFANNFDEETGDPKGSSGVKLSWTATKLTVTITRSYADEADPGSAFVDSLLGSIEPDESDVVRDRINVSASFGGISSFDYHFDVLPVFITGSVKATTKSVGSGDDEMEFPLNSASITGALDTSAPTIKIIVPKGGYEPDEEGRVTIQGTASDGHGFSYLDYYDPGAMDWVEITNITYTKGDPSEEDENWWGPTQIEWEATLTLEQGLNELEFYATDIGGNYKSATVEVVSEIPANYVGRWDALLSEEAGHAGHITITTTASGMVSGKINLQGGVSKSLKGVWHGPHFHAYADEGKESEIYVTAYIVEGTEGSTETVRMDVEVYDYWSDWVGYGQAFRAPYSSSNKIASDSPLIGRFNVEVTAPEAPVLGNGYFSMVTTATGTNTVAGVLADGTSFTASGIVGASGQVPFFASVYKTGCFQSAQELSPDDGTLTEETTAYWSRPEEFSDKQFPEGFDLTLVTEGGLYTPPLANTRILGLTSDGAEAEWVGDAAEVKDTQSILISTKNKITVSDASGFKGSVDTKTGIVKGSFNMDTTPVLKANYSAMIVGDEAVGHYIAPPVKDSKIKRFGEFYISAD